ncbi:ABC transporter ATP-binding protein [Martelella alba]|uniref:ABC transporter ATP-binding protein n=1 Tax=Martelella alba TaxID=2590451 RepID=A0A506UE40_9HYPH|nr:ABC transporter ATP-binding protein [Martelella alba]TPW32230.1 ABC transporter ATP-binding protein [Martelella alba]
MSPASAAPVDLVRERSHSAGARVDVSGVAKHFGDNAVLKSINLSIAPGEVVALLGPSGSGKTTLLRMLAGLMAPSEGRIAIGDTVVADAATGKLVPPEKRSIGMVFQDYALWPHMSVAGNVAFPLEVQHVDRAERKTRVAEALDLVALGPFAERSPATLSGGQQQRVALARAVVSRPSLILFDEPLSNLDRELREQLVVDIAALVRSLGMTGVYVTHDHAEAFAIADRVAVMADGYILQIAAPETLVQQPANAEVASFLKLGLLIPARKSAAGIVVEREGTVLQPPQGFAGDDGKGHLFVPRAALEISGPGEGYLAGRVVHSMFRGDGYSLRLQLDCGIDADLASAQPSADGAAVSLSFAWETVRWFGDN